jgi:hypothetical protein
MEPEPLCAGLLKTWCLNNGQGFGESVSRGKSILSTLCGRNQLVAMLRFAGNEFRLKVMNKLEGLRWCLSLLVKT